jgi:hypothetical protein
VALITARWEHRHGAWYAFLLTADGTAQPTPTSASFAPHPHRLATIVGLVRRSCKHDSHLRYRSY